MERSKQALTRAARDTETPESCGGNRKRVAMPEAFVTHVQASAPSRLPSNPVGR